MRRALLLATALAAPTLGSAQLAAGAMSFTNTDADPKASTINIAECRSGTATVQLAWAPTVTPGAGAVTYQLYASNKDTANTTVFTGLTTTTVNTTCPVEADGTTANGATVVKVGGELTNPTIGNTSFSTSGMAQALKTATAPDPCAGTGTTTIYLCMQGKVGGTVFGTARATITLALTTPDARPELALPISPGNTALTPDWSDPATNTAYYKVQALSLADPSQLPTAGAFDPAGTFTGFDALDTGRHATGFVTGTQARLGGLRNGVTYAVMITSYTGDYNPGDPSNIGTGRPELTSDFWTTYKNAGGQETGGCSTGAAGPVGLLVLAGILGLARRRS